MRFAAVILMLACGPLASAGPAAPLESTPLSKKQADDVFRVVMADCVSRKTDASPPTVPPEQILPSRRDYCQCMTSVFVANLTLEDVIAIEKSKNPADHVYPDRVISATNRAVVVCRRRSS